MTAVDRSMRGTTPRGAALWRSRTRFDTARRQFSSTYSSRPTTTTTNSKQPQRTQRKTALVLGSSGALGSSVARYLSRVLGYQVIGADIVHELPSDMSGDWELDAFCSMMPLNEGDDEGSSASSSLSIPEQSMALYKGVSRILQDLNDNDESELLLDVVVCANGGWQGDPPALRGRERDDEDATALHVQASANVVQHMMNVNLHPVLAAAVAVVPHLCAPQALVVVLGATAALQPTAGMLGYGVAKAATHHVVQTLGSMSTQSLHKSRAGGKRSPQVPTVIGILPTTLDTPSNRKAMANTNSQWTHPLDISKQIGTWLETQPSLRPAAGSLVKVHPGPDGKAVFELVR